MTVQTHNLIAGTARSFFLIFVLTAAASCARVDVVLFTSDVFPPKNSAADVKIIEEKPTQPTLRIAQLTVADTGKKGYKLQGMIRKKAATLGADAIMFGDPEHYYDTSVSYATAYRPYGGYYGGGYGWYGGSYAVGMPVTSKKRKNSLSGLALKFTNEPG